MWRWSLLRASGSWQLRATKSMARLWRDLSKTQQARELLALVYGCSLKVSIRGLKEAKALAGGVSLVSARALGDFRVWHVADLGPRLT